MATLYEIDNAILECLDTETGEILDEARLNALGIERDKKIEDVALWYKNLLADANAYEAEKKVFDSKQKAAKNKAESLKKWLAIALNGEKFKTAKVTVSYRKSEAVEVDDASKLGDDYLRYKEPEPEKEKIKDALKRGVQIRGVRLVEKKNVIIK